MFHNIQSCRLLPESGMSAASSEYFILFMVSPFTFIPPMSFTSLIAISLYKKNRSLICIPEPVKEKAADPSLRIYMIPNSKKITTLELRVYFYQNHISTAK